MCDSIHALAAHHRRIFGFLRFYHHEWRFGTAENKLDLDRRQLFFGSCNFGKHTIKSKNLICVQK